VRHPFFASALLALGVGASVPATAQGLDDVQLHGYATQSFVYSTNNNWDTTDSTDGSAAWTEAVVNITAQPGPRLRIGVQARYFLLGNYGNAISLDWAQADFHLNDRFGFRVGKVKSPTGLFNETQDIDPGQLWVLLPSSIYPIASRNSLLSHYGGVIYGTAPLGESLGKLEYRAFAGQRIIAGTDGVLQAARDAGFTLPNGISGPVYGGDLRWHAPLAGLTLGASEKSEHTSGAVSAFGLQGTNDSPRFDSFFYYGQYERSRLMLAGEYNRIAFTATINFPGIPTIVVPTDERTFYVMSSYRISNKLSGGLYYSSFLNRKADFNSGRYQKDWALAARYDFNPFLYAKVEQHWIDGTGVGYSATNNANLKPTSRMTLLKLGVSF
jgi:hypothetical protein